MEWIHTHTVVVDGRRREVMAFDGLSIVRRLSALPEGRVISLYTRAEWDSADSAYVLAEMRGDGLVFLVGDLCSVCDLPCTDAPASVVVSGRVVPLADLAPLFDDALREALHAEGITDPQHFVDEYAVAHRIKFGEEFVP